MSKFRLLEEAGVCDSKAFAMGPFGSRIKSENYVPSGIPVIRGLNFGASRFDASDLVYLTPEKATELRNSDARQNDLLLVAQGTVGKVGILTEDQGISFAILSQNVMRFRADPSKANPLYLYYWFRTVGGQSEILSFVNPTGVPCISQPLTSLRKFRYPDLPIEDQNKVARVLSCFDDKIEINQKTTKILEEMAQAIFRSWFVDFDPVIDNALAAGNAIPEALKARAKKRQEARVRAEADGRAFGLSADNARYFPGAFEQSEEGLIPKGWKVSKWGDEISLEYGKALRGYDPTTGRHQVFGTNGPIGWTNEFLTTGPGIVLGRKGAYRGIHYSADSFWVIDTAYYVRPKNDTEISWLLCAMQHHQLGQIDDGSPIPSTTRSAVYVRPIVVPCKSATSLFGKNIGALLARRDSLTKQSLSLGAIRDSILPKLVSGGINLR